MIDILLIEHCAPGVPLTRIVHSSGIGRAGGRRIDRHRLLEQRIGASQFEEQKNSV